MKVFILLSIVAGAFALRDCPANQHYESCGTACPLTCDNYNDPPRGCVLMCNPGCHCDEGYVKSEGGECVLPENCPNSAIEVCGENQRYTGCGTACPLTCDNHQNPPKFCTLQCVIGCECEQGYVKTSDGRCVLPENCPSRTNAEEENCLAEPDEGMCRGYFPMFHYDVKSGTCKEFIYGGCQGNGNRYGSEEECLENCGGVKQSSSDVCSLPSETGLCRGYFPRYYFNKASGQCEEFVYGGCGGNENNFETQEDCQKSCGNSLNHVCSENEKYTTCGTACPLTCDNYQNPPKACTKQCVIGCQCAKGYVKTADGQCVLPENCPSRSLQRVLDRPDCDKAPEVGFCRARIPRFYYDQQAGMCKTFIYGGCGGNRNNFESEFDCLNKCGALASSGNAVCEQEKVVGPCRAAFPRYHFNKQTGQCERFIYGGCGGNGNNFVSKDACESTCVA